jgi:hypothetical protein
MNLLRDKFHFEKYSKIEKISFGVPNRQQLYQMGIFVGQRKIKIS